MAGMLRNQNDLIALRCRLTFTKKAWAVGSELWEGSHQISEEVFTPLAELGISLDKAKDDYQSPHFTLNYTQIGTQLQEAGNIASIGDANTPIWLQLSRNAQALSAFPWEVLSREITNRALLRIPNFLIDPFTPPLVPRIAICASVPMAKAIYNVGDYLNMTLEAIDPILKDTSFTSKVTLFLDEPTARYANQEGRFKSMPHIDIAVADPAEAEKHGTAAKTYGNISSAKDTIRNPWLLWILDHFEHQSVDSIHFISPSYFSGDSGALAFAPSPLVNNDREWSRFIGAQELSDFCDRLHCNAMLFSSASSAYWRIGHRLLVNELSWLRPGPIIHFDESSDSREALKSIYAAIYGRAPFVADHDYTVQSSLHPDIIKRGFEDGSEERSVDVDEYIRSHAGKLSVNSQRLKGNKVLLESLMKHESSEVKTPTALPQHMKILAQKRAKLSQRTLKSPQQLEVDKGRMKALDFLSQLPKRGEF